MGKKYGFKSVYRQLGGAYDGGLDPSQWGGVYDGGLDPSQWGDNQYGGVRVKRKRKRTDDDLEAAQILADLGRAENAIGPPAARRRRRRGSHRDRAFWIG